MSKISTTNYDTIATWENIMITKQIPITISIILVHFAKSTKLVNLLITTPKAMLKTPNALNWEKPNTVKNYSKANKDTTFKIAKNSGIIKL